MVVNGTNVMRRPKLVDYSDSEGEPMDPFGPVVSPGEQPSPPEPQDENELAQIVIQLQHEYTEEVANLERRHEEAERQLRVWKARIEDRLQLQVNVMASIIKEVFGVDATNPTLQDNTLQSDESNGHAATQVPPSPSPSVTPPALVEPSVQPTVPLPRHRNMSRVTSPVHVREGRPEPPARSEDGRQLQMVHPSAPLVTRSTGKKAPRPRPIGASHRPYEATRKPRNRASETSRARAVKTGHGQAMAMSSIDESHETAEPTADAGAEDSPPPPTRAQAAPLNPYEDPKYFSTLTVFDKDGKRRPIFQFHQHPATVEEQWAEFRHGLHGQPPVEQLEALYRAKWRNSTYGRSWFTRRKAFWDRVKEMLAEGRTEGQALEAMRRRAEGGGVPSLIAQLCRERSHGSRPDRRRDRPRLPGHKRGTGGGCDGEEDVDLGRESDEYSETGRSSPLRLRKRVRVSVAGQEQDNDEV